jgi:hypothetical protein
MIEVKPSKISQLGGGIMKVYIKLSEMRGKKGRS